MKTEPRYELDALIPSSVLSDLLAPFVKATRLAAGIVKNPGINETIPDIPGEIHKWRYTPVWALDRNHQLIDGGSRFCAAVRSLTAGDRLCMKADLAFAKTAYAKRAAIDYICEPGGLKDTVAPVTVGGHHLANVYLGQLRPCNAAFDQIWNQYQTLQAKSTNATEGVETRTDLSDLFQQLWADNEVFPQATINELLTRLAHFISQMASRQAALLTIAEICSNTGATYDLDAQASMILRKMSRTLRFNSGSIMILQEGLLVPVGHNYPQEIAAKMRIEPGSPVGISALTFQSGEVQLFRTRAELEASRPPAVPGSRDARRLQSLLAAPLVVAGQKIGVIEIGDDEEMVYAEDDKQLLSSLAQYVAMHWKSSQEYIQLTSIVQQDKHETLRDAIVAGIPKLVHAGGCSIFLRDLSKWRIMLREMGAVAKTDRAEFSRELAFLAATTELSREPELNRQLTYKPMQGLTGWVLATGRPLLIASGPGARTTNLPKLKPPAVWEGAYPDLDAAHLKDYYETRPFLAVPIKAASGAVLGVIRVNDSVSGDFTPSDQRTLETCAAALASAMQAYASTEAMLALDTELERLGKDLQQNSANITELGIKARALIRKSVFSGFAWLFVGVASCAALFSATTLATRGPLATWLPASFVVAAFTVLSTRAFKEARKEPE